MDKLKKVPRVYLDNCCYNRPYDSQLQGKIRSETSAKLCIQELIKCKCLELATSYILDYENNNNKYLVKRNSIRQFMRDNETAYITSTSSDFINSYSRKLSLLGLKYMDSAHIACAILSGCNYFITVDYRVLKAKTSDIQIVSPQRFLELYRRGNYEGHD